MDAGTLSLSGRCNRLLDDFMHYAINDSPAAQEDNHPGIGAVLLWGNSAVEHFISVKAPVGALHSVLIANLNLDEQKFRVILKFRPHGYPTVVRCSSDQQ